MSTFLHTLISQSTFDAGFFLLLIGAFFRPLFANRIFNKVELFGANLARRTGLAILVIALSPILVRVALLTKVPSPVPEVHDEFSYLLGGDTIVHGRLSNPPHPMWVFFDTIHVNQHPTYMSKYPPAQAAMIALGELLGHPWIGVLLSGAAMYAAILWMLCGWFPSRWALLGGVLLIVQLEIFNYWTGSYWGGAVAATGGALVMGALPRIFHFQRPRDALLFALGAGILANSRPYEGFVLSIPVFIVLGWWLISRRSPAWRVTIPRVVAPIAGMLVLTAAFICYYNWRGTGNPFLFPYTLNTREYFREPLFIWQKPLPPIKFMNAQLDRFYNWWSYELWAIRAYDGTIRSLAHIAADTLSGFRRFYVPIGFLVTLVLAAPWVIRDRRTRLHIALAAICIAGSSVTAYFSYHYIAPLTATFLAIVVQAMRHVRRLRWGDRPIGVGFTRAIVAACVLLTFVHAAKAIRDFPSDAAKSKIQVRARIERQLEQVPGEHLVIVRYKQNHNPVWEWVYNRADIDHARVVWAREIPELDMKPLFEYFHGRKVWLVEADTTPPSLGPYSPEPQVGKSIR
jgi:hypothetical protein